MNNLNYKKYFNYFSNKRIENYLNGFAHLSKQCYLGIPEGTAGENEKDKPGLRRGPSHKGEGHRIFEEYDTERLPAEGN